MANLGAWLIGTTYAAGDTVTSGGRFWESLQSANTGHAPAQGAWWNEIFNPTAAQLEMEGKDLSTVSHLVVHTTAARPTAAAAGVGAVYYDSTVHKPVYSDGTTWYDSTHTAV